MSSIAKSKGKTKAFENTSSNNKIRGCFGLRNGVVHVHHLLASHFFVWFVEWNGWMIYHHIIPHKLMINMSMRGGVIPP